MGTIVWGKLPGYEWWPGVVISYTRGKERDSRGRGGGGEGGEGEEDEKEMQVWVKWYGESNLSQVSAIISCAVSREKCGVQQACVVKPCDKGV